MAQYMCPRASPAAWRSRIRQFSALSSRELPTSGQSEYAACTVPEGIQLHSHRQPTHPKIRARQFLPNCRLGSADCSAYTD